MLTPIDADTDVSDRDNIDVVGNEHDICVDDAVGSGRHVDVHLVYIDVVALVVDVHAVVHVVAADVVVVFDIWFDGVVIDLDEAHVHDHVEGDNGVHISDEVDLIAAVVDVDQQQHPPKRQRTG